MNVETEKINGEQYLHLCQKLLAMKLFKVLFGIKK